MVLISINYRVNIHANILETCMQRKIIVLLTVFFLLGCSTLSVTTATTTDTPAVATTVPNPSGVNPADAPFLPNPAWQPGAIDPSVTQDNIQSTICVSGYTSTIRPPASYTDKLKKEQIQQYGYSDTKLADYEEDHLISLELGGNPTDPKNLWPEPRDTTPYNSHVKDTLENTLHKLVCEGKVPLATAQQAIATDWVAAYHQYVGNTIISAGSSEP
jgi:hypothetical protein